MLHALEQYPRVWFGWFSKVVKGYVLQRDQKDNSISFPLIQRKRTLLVVYIDDIVTKGYDWEGVQNLKAYTHQKFHIKILDNYDISWVLIKVTRSKKEILIEEVCFRYAISIREQAIGYSDGPKFQAATHIPSCYQINRSHCMIRGNKRTLLKSKLSTGKLG